MINGYYYYETPMMNYVNHALVLGIVVLVSLIVGVILFFTFFRKKNERKFTGVKGKIYHFMNFNRFYAEDILRFVYIVATCVVTAVGIATIVLGSFLVGIAELIGINLALRVAFELVMMFIILCRKTVSLDRKLDRIANYYDDGYEADCCSDEACDSCDSECDSCDLACGSCEDNCEDDSACDSCEDYCEDNPACDSCSGCALSDTCEISNTSEGSDTCENSNACEGSSN